MSNPDTNNIGIKLQAAGENLNTWGDPNLNNDLKVLSNLASKWSVIALTGDYSVNETNYSTTNDTEVAVIKVTGLLSSPANFITSGRYKRFVFWNAAGAKVTVRTSAGTGVAIPNNGIALLGCDTNDIYNISPTHLGTSTQATDANAVALWGAVQTAIATASLPATAGTSLVDATDTTAGYLNQKLTVTGSLTKSVVNSPGNETLNIDFTYDEGQSAIVGGFYGL